MSIGSSLKHLFGIVSGILIPGADPHTTDLTHSIQEEVAQVYGAAAAKMAADLNLDATKTGSEKKAILVKAIVDTAKQNGFKGDLHFFTHVVDDVAQAAFRKAEPNIGAGIMALAAALTANPLVSVAAELVSGVVQKEADKMTGTGTA